MVFALTYCQRRGTRLGVALQELGLLPPDEIQRTLRRQIEDSVCDLFLWRRGVFFFQESEPPEEELLPEPINTLGLVLEGARWMDEYARLRELILHDDVLLRPGPNRDGKRSSPLQRRISEHMKGEVAVGALYKVVQGSYFRFLEALYDLCTRDVLEIEIVGEGDAGESSKEIGIYDLLLEQATEEQGTRLRRRLGLPPDIIEDFYPVWVREPSARELHDLPQEVSAWLQRIDGSRTLGELLSDDRVASTQHTNFLGLQLRQGALALLPQPLDQLQGEADVHEESAWPIALRRGELRLTR